VADAEMHALSSDENGNFGASVQCDYTSTNMNVVCSFINMTSYVKSNIITQFASSTTVLLKFVTGQNLKKRSPDSTRIFCAGILSV